MLSLTAMRKRLARRGDENGAQLVMMRWELVPFWAPDTKIAYKTINARVETVATAPACRAAFKARRCLILADGFYEWKKLDAKTKQPYRFVVDNGSPFAFAGLWETWDKGEGRLTTCTIITGEPTASPRPSTIVCRRFWTLRRMTAGYRGRGCRNPDAVPGGADARLSRLDARWQRQER